MPLIHLQKMVQLKSGFFLGFGTVDIHGIGAFDFDGSIRYNSTIVLVLSVAALLF
jgi:hypothetical protein